MAFVLNLIFFLATLFSGTLSGNHRHHHQHARIDPVRLLILLAPIVFIVGQNSVNLGAYAFKKRANVDA